MKLSAFAFIKLVKGHLIKNQQNEWIESTNSNLFIVYKGSIFTPSVKTGCVAGIMRMNVINLCLENGFKVYEHAITEEVLKNPIPHLIINLTMNQN